MRQPLRYIPPPFTGIKFAIVFAAVFLFSNSAFAGWVYFPDAEYSSPQFGGLNVFTGTWDTVFLGAGGIGGDFVTGGLVSPLDSHLPYPSLTGMQVASIVNNGLTTDPYLLSPLNPINAPKIGADFFQYGSYMLGVLVLGMSAGMGMGALLGLIKKFVR